MLAMISPISFDSFEIHSEFIATCFHDPCVECLRAEESWCNRPPPKVGAGSKVLWS
jgi:hypothetical protein